MVWAFFESLNWWAWSFVVVSRAGAVTAEACWLCQCVAGSYQTGSGSSWQRRAEECALDLCIRARWLRAAWMLLVVILLLWCVLNCNIATLPADERRYAWFESPRARTYRARVDRAWKARRSAWPVCFFLAAMQRMAAPMQRSHAIEQLTRERVRRQVPRPAAALQGPSPLLQVLPHATRPNRR
jgi:hypothetical protein